MAAKDVKFAGDARERMLRGVETLANAVKVINDLRLIAPTNMVKIIEEKICVSCRQFCHPSEYRLII